ncbi:MAG TPA: hypothetical protein VGL77_21710 [Armatimonadota bacterium]|jgi:hypothetical protein
MSDGITVSEIAPLPPRQRATGWLVLTGILLVALLVATVWGVKQTRNLKASMATQLAAQETRHAAEVEKLLQVKATAIAAALQMVNADLLSDAGQKNAQSFFGELLQGDESIAFVALLDKGGNVRATTDLRIMRDATPGPVTLTKVQLNTTPANGADFEADGPITDTNGQVIGAVRVGVKQVVKK